MGTYHFRECFSIGITYRAKIYINIALNYIKLKHIDIFIYNHTSL